MLETWNLVHKYTPICSLRKIPFSTKPPLILLMSAFFLQKTRIFVENSIFIVRELYLRFLVLFSVFVRKKVVVNENVSFTDHASGIRLPDCCKLAINWENDNDVTIYQHEVIVIFWHCHDSFVKFSYVNIVSGSRVMTIFLFLKDRWEIRKSKIPPSEFCPMSRDWGNLRIPNLTQMSLMKCYWILQNARITAVNVIERNPTERVKLLTHITVKR